MERSRTTNSITNMITGIVFKVVGILFPFLIRSITIQKLGVEYLGLNTLFTSLLQVLSLSELGFSIAVAHSMYKPIAENDVSTLSAILNLLKNVYRVVGLVILLLGIGIMPFLTNFIEGSYPNDVNIYVLYLIFLFNTVISYFLFAYKGVLISAHQRLDVENILSLIINIILYTLQIIILIAFKDYLLYILAMPIMTIILNVVRNYVVNRMYPLIKANGVVNKFIKRQLVRDIFALIGHKISGVVIASISNIIISANLGLETLATYSNYMYIVTALLSIVDIVHNSFLASVGNSIVVNSKDKNYKDFCVLTFANICLVGWMSITLLCVMQDFITIWVGAEYLLPFETVILFVCYLYFWKFKDILSLYKNAAGMWMEDFAKPYAVTVATLCLSLLLIKVLGINGVLIAGIVGFFVISMPWETAIFFKKYFNKGQVKYYLKMLFYTLIILALAMLTFYLCSLIHIEGFFGLCIKALICVTVPNILLVVIFSKTKEFKVVKNKLMKIISRNK